MPLNIHTFSQPIIALALEDGTTLSDKSQMTDVLCFANAIKSILPLWQGSDRALRKLANKVRGCLLGVAIGDALGAPFEHLLPGETNQALERFGGRITDFHPYWSRPAGAWTDDTGMTLASVQAFIEMEQTGLGLEDSFQTAFCDWAISSECRKACGTVLYAAGYASADLNSWSNGALMRIAPAGIYASLKGLGPEKSAEIAYRSGRMTHFRPLAVFPAVSAALAIRSILCGEQNVPHLPTAHTLCREYITTDRRGAALRYKQEYLDRYTADSGDEGEKLTYQAFGQS